MVKTKNSQIFECSECSKEYANKLDAENCEIRDKREKRIEEMSNRKNFFIMGNHLLLLKRMEVSWDDCEFGAPCIDPKRPYGNSDVLDDIAEIIGIKKDKNTIDYDKDEAKEYDSKEDYFSDAEWSDKTYELLNNLHRDMQIVLQIVLATGKTEIGNYVKKNEYDSQSWEKTK